MLINVHFWVVTEQNYENPQTEARPVGLFQSRTEAYACSLNLANRDCETNPKLSVKNHTLYSPHTWSELQESVGHILQSDENPLIKAWWIRKVG